jgi:hypothetical protein
MLQNPVALIDDREDLKHYIGNRINQETLSGPVTRDTHVRGLQSTEITSEEICTKQLE